MNTGPRNSGFSGKSSKKSDSKSGNKSGGKSGRKSTAKSGPKSRGMKGPAAQSPKRAYGAKSHGATARPQSPNSPKNRAKTRPNDREERRNNGASRGANGGANGGNGWIWGTHACLAALHNPKRTIHKLLVSEAAYLRLEAAQSLPKGGVIAQPVDVSAIERALPRGVVHQGIALKAAPLEWPDMESLADRAGGNGLILVLDQITDPHNVGAMLRLASAFGVTALIMQTRKAPPLAGATAKVAVGCLETVPVCLETNIANSLQKLQKIGWHVTGLAGEAEQSVAQTLSSGGKQVIVMGAEGPGLRERVRKTCDQLAHIPMMSAQVGAKPNFGAAESLNVATAAAIALYEARRTDKK